MTQERILVIGALGQIGSELVEALYKDYGVENVIASDIKPAEHVHLPGKYVTLNVMDKAGLYALLQAENINIIYNLAAILSATGESKPLFAWELNMDGLLNTLEAARELESVRQIFWPSSIAVFGPSSPKQNTPQDTVMDPNTVYGISKLAGELWCAYYAEKYGVDVRSIRYPGLIGYKAAPGGGTTDYAVDIYHYAVQNKEFSCFLSQNSYLPMMYMEDALRATISLMQAPAEQVKIRTSYNLSGMSFSPAEIAASIQKHYPAFSIVYNPEPMREKIAGSWPQSIDDSRAQQDWGWKAEYDLDKMTKIMLENVALQYQTQTI